MLDFLYFLSSYRRRRSFESGLKMKGQAQTTVILYVSFLSVHVLPTLYPQIVDLAAGGMGSHARTASSSKICVGRCVGCFPSTGRRS